MDCTSDFAVTAFVGLALGLARALACTQRPRSRFRLRSYFRAR